MRRLKIVIRQEDKNAFLGYVIAGSFFLMALPLALWYFLSIYNITSPPVVLKMALIGFCLLLVECTGIYLTSRFSPIKSLRLRKKLILFSRLLTQQKEDSGLLFSVEWCFQIQGDKTVIELFSNGLIGDKAQVGRQLSEYLRMDMLKFEEQIDRAVFTFGKPAERYDGLEVLRYG